MALAASYRFMSDFPQARPDRDSVMLYDAAIAALEAAVEAIDRDDIEVRCRGVYTATEAVTSLYLNLDVKRFGELADDLAELYGHILGCLVGINYYNDIRIADDAIELLHALNEQRSAATGMEPARFSASMSTHVTHGTRPEHNTQPSSPT